MHLMRTLGNSWRKSRYRRLEFLIIYGRSEYRKQKIIIMELNLLSLDAETQDTWDT